MENFASLGLSDNALDAVARLGYDEPTPVQEQAIPIVLTGRDLIAAASTGTGKTAAFLLPVLSRMPRDRSHNRPPRLLVVSPTRELAQQIAFTAMKIARCTGQFVTTVFGGAPYGPQIKEIRRGTDVLIATPGRLNDLMKREVVDLSGVQTLVLDEADRMLDMGFLPDVTFGMKFGSWAWALKRAQTRLEQAREVAATGAISGAVGTYSSIDPFVEQYVCEKLGLTPDPLSTQVLARDRHAQVMCTLACAAATLESIAMQVRLLQQSDVIEAEEPFKKGQKGSSAMPHKRNPITAERVCGLARVVKANAQVALDNVALWYERDISHSGTERVALADSFTALDYMFGKMQWILDGLQTYPDKMEHNLWRTRGLIFSSKVLLALVQTGITREEAYVIVQRNAMKVWEDIQNAVEGPTYRERLEADPEAKLTKETLDEIFDPWDFLTRKDEVFKRLESLEF